MKFYLYDGTEFEGRDGIKIFKYTKPMKLSITIPLKCGIKLLKVTLSNFESPEECDKVLHFINKSIEAGIFDLSVLFYYIEGIEILFGDFKSRIRQEWVCTGGMTYNLFSELRNVRNNISIFEVDGVNLAFDRLVKDGNSEFLVTKSNLLYRYEQDCIKYELNMGVRR